ncbi:hypothetical protein DFJ73DRAFT_871326 [Zopfochytrium polystomum]|nr:hypothetical protein DFJ73DRAFT_871326 [Zopfochytrium polystomum]
MIGFSAIIIFSLARMADFCALSMLFACFLCALCICDRAIFCFSSRCDDSIIDRCLSMLYCSSASARACFASSSNSSNLCTEPISSSSSELAISISLISESCRALRSCSSRRNSVSFCWRMWLCWTDISFSLRRWSALVVSFIAASSIAWMRSRVSMRRFCAMSSSFLSDTCRCSSLASLNLNAIRLFLIIPLNAWSLSRDSSWNRKNFFMIPRRSTRSDSWCLRSKFLRKSAFSTSTRVSCARCSKSWVRSCWRVSSRFALSIVTSSSASLVSANAPLSLASVMARLRWTDSLWLNFASTIAPGCFMAGNEFFFWGVFFSCSLSGCVCRETLRGAFRERGSGVFFCGRKRVGGGKE